MFNYIRKKLRETTFDKIKVGEVFATLGCTNYFVKTEKEKAIYVDTDFIEFVPYIGLVIDSYRFNMPIHLNSNAPGKVYRVPKDVQDRYYIQ